MEIELRGTCPHWISEKEILQAINFFLRYCGVERRNEEIIIELKPDNGFQFDTSHGTVASDTVGCFQDGVITLFLKALEEGLGLSPRIETLLTVFHELDHWLWKAQGGSFNFDLPYFERPHEIRAFQNEWPLLEAFLGIHFGTLRGKGGAG